MASKYISFIEGITLNEDTIRVLEDIIELADRLQSHQFEKIIDEKGLNWVIQIQPEGDYLIQFEYPDDTVFDATLYTLRLFNQQSEKVSFHNLNRLANDEGLSVDFRDGIKKLRKQYFSYLSKYPIGVEPGFFEEGYQPDNGDILKVVINGGFGHRKDFDKRQWFKKWTRDGIRAGVLFQTFSVITFNIIGLIHQLKKLCESEISNTNDG